MVFLTILCLQKVSFVQLSPLDISLDTLTENIRTYVLKNKLGKKGVMKIFDSRYFYLNKQCLIFIGAWPYDPRKKCIRNFWFCTIVVMSLPHIIGLKVNFSVPVKMLEHVVAVLHMFVMFAKLLTLTLFEKKVKNMYEIIAKNWEIIVDEDEKKILVDYSNRGRYFTIIYFLFFIAIGISFITFPLLPALLYKIKVVSRPQPLMYIFNGEFLVKDRNSHYWTIYVFDCMTSFTVLAIYAPIDGMYRVCVEQCFALYAIITHRLSKLHAPSTDKKSKNEDDSFDRILQIIKLHKRTLRFNQSLQKAYSACFLMILLANIIEIPVGCNLIIITLHNDPIKCFRITTIVATMFAHLFWICWPGQKLIDHSSRLSFDADWYRLPKKSLALLKIFMLRCRDPVYITAGGLININMENYASTLRTALSYTTVLHQFDKKIL